ncbi:MAG TPA: glutathione S-transferase [Xanthobacteraceae bacterium]|nr:glutathione S-transferase [Xanthobacteraceae bacterium]
MAEYQLYCFAQSGNSYKAALMLNLIGADWTPVFVDFFKGETRSDAYRANVNEMGEAPVLVHGATKLSQSGVILTYLAARSGRFGGDTQAERREALRWILFDNHKFTSYVATYRFLRAFAKAGDPAVLSFLKGRIDSAFNIVEKHLAARPFVAGEKPTIADLSMCGYLYYPPEELGFDIAADYRAIAAWLERIKALPGWEHPHKLMPGHPLPS